MIRPVETRDLNRRPSDQRLREDRIFAYSLAAGFFFVALLVLRKGSASLAVVASSLALIALLAGTLMPGRLERVRGAWMKLGDAIGYVTTPLLMAIVYYLIVAPIGVTRRFVARRPMSRASYWHQRPPQPPPQRMERQF